jgi:hypothetical protein
MIAAMSPELLLLLLLTGLVALVPVRRLHQGGWSSGALFSAWIVYAVGLFLGMRFPGLARFLLPVVAIGFVAPYALGERRLAALARLFGARPAAPRPVIDVTPRPSPGLPSPDGRAPVSRPSSSRRWRRRPPVEDRD